MISPSFTPVSLASPVVSFFFFFLFVSNHKFPFVKETGSLPVTSRKFPSGTDTFHSQLTWNNIVVIIVT